MGTTVYRSIVCTQIPIDILLCSNANLYLVLADLTEHAPPLSLMCLTQNLDARTTQNLAQIQSVKTTLASTTTKVNGLVTDMADVRDNMTKIYDGAYQKPDKWASLLPPAPLRVCIRLSTSSSRTNRGPEGVSSPQKS